MIMVLVNHKHGVGRPGPGGRGEATDTLTGPGRPSMFSGAASPPPAGALLAQESLAASSGETA